MTYPHTTEARRLAALADDLDDRLRAFEARAEAAADLGFPSDLRALADARRRAADARAAADAARREAL